MVYEQNVEDGHALAAQAPLNRLLGLILLIYCAPLIAAIALAVKLTGGPILQPHVRIDGDGRRIREWRFRVRSADGATTTAIGAILRLTRMELLPQVVNVVRGELAVTALLR